MLSLFAVPVLYAQAHSPDSTDLLPGLCMLSQSWLQEAIVDGFRPDAFAGQEQADLGQWFDDRKVQVQIQASDVMQTPAKCDSCCSSSLVALCSCKQATRCCWVEPAGHARQTDPL